MDMKLFAQAVLSAQRIHEESYVVDDLLELDDGDPIPTGHYTKDHYQAACEALGIPFDPLAETAQNMAYPISLLNWSAWNDVQSWAEDVLGIVTPDVTDEN